MNTPCLTRTTQCIAARLLLVAFAAVLATAGAAQAQTGPIDALRATLESPSLDIAQREAIQAQLDTATRLQGEAEGMAARAETLRAENASMPQRLEALRQSLTTDREAALGAWAARLPGDADAEFLERLLQQETTLAAQLRADIEQVGAELAQAFSRTAQDPAGPALLRRRIEDLSAPPVARVGEPGALLEARRLRRAAELAHAQAELALRLAEQDTAGGRQRQLDLRLRQLRQELGARVARIELLQQRIAERAQGDLEGRLEHLTQRAEALAGSGPVAAAAAAENLRLGVELQEGQRRLNRERASLAALEQEQQRLQQSLREARARLELGDASEQVGRWLWSERRRLEPPARLTQRLRQMQNTLAELRLRRIALAETQRELVDLRAAAAALQRTDSDGTEEDAPEDVDSAPIAELLGERVPLLDMLQDQVERRISTLEQGERALSGQIESAAALQRTLDRRLLWIPSHAAIGRDWIERVPAGLHDLVKPSRLVTTAELLARDVALRPLRYVVSALLVIGLLMLRRRARTSLEALAAHTRRVRLDRFRYTLHAFGWTLLIALPLPLMAWLGGQLLQGIGTTGRFSDSLGRALAGLALPLLAFQFLRHAATEHGLGHAHFRWTRARRETLRRWIPRLALMVLPLHFVILLAFSRNQELAIDVSARLALVALAVLLGLSLWRMLGAGMLWVTRSGDGEPSTPRRVLRVAAPVILAAIALLALAGNVYTAAILLRAMLAGFIVVVAISTLLGLFARWFLLGERRLMVKRAEERRSSEALPVDESGEPMPELEAEITLEQVNTQTSRLLRALRLSLLTVGLVWVFSDVLPAFARLDEVALWHFSDVDAEGNAVRLPVSLMAALIGAFALLLTVVAARNLPGLIEITLLSRTRVDSGARYAITNVLRYGIVIVGTLVGFSLLGLRWSQLQWMAAALTVGLGFGLQEIFANFVSGLILLFERPFRVGDVITVGDLSGRVTRIRTRATTILDFDNKEIVVPNKTFITGQLINWTLSDTTTRITIKVGVAYGTNPDQVHQLLLQAARENTRVLPEPEPRSWFLSFGDSALDFELRVFVATLADRLAVQNEINTRIAHLFAEHGIEIAFPQLDLHVRDLPTVLGKTDPDPKPA
jgi:potassium-dependent mechanosensitive channel